MDDDEILFPCPVCGEELAEMDTLWRQVHITGCVSRSKNKTNPDSDQQICPICKMKLGNVAPEIANKHINHCLDSSNKRKSESRKTERCPICGQNIKKLNDRQRKLHDQTCRHSERAQDVDVFQYPKVVEDLPTPEPWELLPPPPSTEPKPFHITIEPETPKVIYGRTMDTASLQCLAGFSYQNSQNILIYQ